MKPARLVSEPYLLLAELFIPQCLCNSPMVLSIGDFRPDPDSWNKHEPSVYSVASMVYSTYGVVLRNSVS